MASGYLTEGHDEDKDISVTDMMEDLADIEWWDEFTGYYDGVIEDKLAALFDKELCPQLSKCIMNQLI